MVIIERWNIVNKKEERQQVRTDLAVEAKDMYVENNEKQKTAIKGVTIKHRTENDIKVTHVDIDEVGAAALGKKAGSYTTIYTDGVKKQDTSSQEKASKVLALKLNICYHKRIFRKMQQV